MSAKTAKKRVGLTGRNGRQGKQADRRQLTDADDTPLTAVRRTRKYSPRARKCAYKDCQNSFKPHAKHGKFCSDKCRKAEARRKEKKGMKGQVKERELVVCECLYCTNTFFAEPNKGAKYCSDSHRELAYRQRRSATVAALTGDLNVSQDDAQDMVERMGMARCSRYLRGRGYAYDENLRAWLLPVSDDISVRLAG